MSKFGETSWLENRSNKLIMFNCIDSENDKISTQYFTNVHSQRICVSLSCGIHACYCVSACMSGG